MPTMSSMSDDPKAQVPQPTRWLKRVLIPFWVAQLLLMLLIIVVECVFTAIIMQISGLLLLIVSSVCIILTITETVLFGRKKLRPVTYLVLQVVKTAIWLAMFLMTVVDSTLLENRQASGPSTAYSADKVTTTMFDGLIWATVLLVSFIGSLVYASVTYHRHRRAKKHRAQDSADLPSSEGGHPHDPPRRGSNYPTFTSPVWTDSKTAPPRYLAGELDGVERKREAELYASTSRAVEKEAWSPKRGLRASAVSLQELEGEQGVPELSAQETWR